MPCILSSHKFCEDWCSLMKSIRDIKASTPAAEKSAVGGDMSSMKRDDSGLNEGSCEKAAMVLLFERHDRVRKRFKMNDANIHMKFVRVKPFRIAAWGQTCGFAAEKPSFGNAACEPSFGNAAYEPSFEEKPEGAEAQR